MGGGKAGGREGREGKREGRGREGGREGGRERVKFCSQMLVYSLTEWHVHVNINYGSYRLDGRCEGGKKGGREEGKEGEALTMEWSRLHICRAVLPALANR